MPSGRAKLAIHMLKRHYRYNRIISLAADIPIPIRRGIIQIPIETAGIPTVIPIPA